MNKICCYYVLAGNTRFLLLGRPAINLAPGDFLCLGHGTEHRWQSEHPERTERFEGFKSLQPSDEPPQFDFGAPREPGKPSCEILAAAFGLGLDGLSISRTAMPGLTVLRPGEATFASFPAPPEMVRGFSGAGAYSFAASIIKIFFDQAVRHSLQTAQANHLTAVGAVHFANIAAALRLIEGNLAHHWTVARLADSVGMSRSVFAASFAALVGEPPLCFIRNCRMTHANRLLQRDHDTIGEIAAAVGYRSHSAFARKFLEHFGMSPRAIKSASGQRRC